MKTTDMVKSAMKRRKNSETYAPPWFPRLLPLGMLIIAAYMGYSIMAAGRDEPADVEERPAETPVQQEMFEPQLEFPASQTPTQQSYLVAMAAAANLLLEGDPGIPTASGLPLPEPPEWVRGTFRYDRADRQDELEGSYWFTVLLTDGNVHELNMQVIFDGRRWIIRG